MHFEWLKFGVATLLNGTFHCLNDLQFQTVRQMCGKATPTPAYQLVDSSKKVVSHFLTDADMEALHKLWPIREQFVHLKMPSRKAYAIAVIDWQAACDRFVYESLCIKPQRIWILPGAKLGKMVASLDYEPRTCRDRLIKSSETFEPDGEQTLQTAHYFTTCTHAVSFVIGSRQALNTYGFDIHGIPLDQKPTENYTKEDFKPKPSAWWC
jgi:hypothetical protein